MTSSIFRAPASGEIRNRWRRISPAVLFCAMVAGTLTLAGFAQTQPPPHPQGPIILPEANRPPDANDQMIMREQNAQKRNFDAANAERLKQLEQASQMLETMAIALKAEVDKSGDMSQNTIHKAETIEKLARIVKDKMSITVAPD